jgi:hypothetical protein
LELEKPAAEPVAGSRQRRGIDELKTWKRSYLFRIGDAMAAKSCKK